MWYVSTQYHMDKNDVDKPVGFQGIISEFNWFRDIFKGVGRGLLLIYVWTNGINLSKFSFWVDNASQ